MSESFICKVQDLRNGEMKSFNVTGDEKILVTRVNDSFYGLGASCPHYGAPLEEGILTDETIICPWHHSCFNAKSGDLMEPPSFDSLKKFELNIHDGNIYVKSEKEYSGGRLSAMVKPNPNDKRHFVIIGGGGAGSIASLTLREAGYTGRITIVTPEEREPYDRPNLSKDYLAGHAQEEWMPLRSPDIYKDYGIRFLLGCSAVELNSDTKTLKLISGDSINYDKILLTSGSIPRKVEISGGDLKNIFLLRSFSDCEHIITASEKVKKICIIGGSFIGMETAISLKDRLEAEISVVLPGDVPFVKVFGREIGTLFLEHHKSKGIIFHTGTKVKSFEGDGSVSRVILENGETIETDIVVVGVGVVPATGYIKDIEKEKDGSIRVDNRFRTKKDDVYAAGDIASFPDWRTGQYARIEHWRTALQQGRTAAFNMAGIDKPYESIPFFWTKQGDVALTYIGHANKWDEIIFKGKPVLGEEFIALYIKDDKIIAAAGNKDKEMAAINELMRRKKMPAPEQVKRERIDWISEAS